MIRASLTTVATRAASSLSHPGIVTIFDIFEHGDQAGIAMELVEGRTLSSVIPAGGLQVREAALHGECRRRPRRNPGRRREAQTTWDALEVGPLDEHGHTAGARLEGGVCQWSRDTDAQMEQQQREAAQAS